MKNFLDKTPPQPSTVRIKKWVKISDESHGTYNNNS